MNRELSFSMEVGLPPRRRHALGGLAQRHGAFTLVELLVVISIIALLASLTVALSGLAARKSKEARLKGDLNRYVTAIENYKATFGTYPRDNPGRPSTNQLFYELTGTYYTGGATRDGRFEIPGRPDVPLSATAVTRFFSAPGFGNSVRKESGEKLRFTEEFKTTQYKAINANPEIDVLIVPVPGPKTFNFNGVEAPLTLRAADGIMVNPWLYDSSSPNRNNRQGFDLWAEVVIGKNVVRFCNWDKDPVVIGPAR